MSSVDAVTSDLLEFEWESSKYFAGHYVEGN
jgi:hypothetical protein